MAGTTRWFASIGMRPAWVHAYVATLTEIGAGVLLLLGLLTPLAAAAVLGTMLVALVTAPPQERVLHLPAGPGV